MRDSLSQRKNSLLEQEVKGNFGRKFTSTQMKQKNLSLKIEVNLKKVI